jgi:hypothetical protein
MISGGWLFENRVLTRSDIPEKPGKKERQEKNA